MLTIILVLKLLGFSLLNILSNTFYIKLYFITSISVVILYLLLSLFFLYKFSSQDIKIPEILPNFIITWLEEIQVMSKTKPGFKTYKDMVYIELSIYIFALIFAILVLK